MNSIEKLIEELCPGGASEVRIDEFYIYEQPTRFLVSTKDYKDKGVPVLTAGKTFLLGYTEETDGVYKASADNPVILFDDFTTAYKWVDFDFKVKSSALKIIRAKDSSVIALRFLFHLMGVIAYQPAQHSRHWISVYSKLMVSVPPFEIQKEIVEILDKFTQLEAELEAELEARKKQYEALRSMYLDFDLESNVNPLSEKVRELCPEGVSNLRLSEAAAIKIGEFVKKTLQSDDFEYPVFNGGTTPTGYYSDFNSYENSVVISARGSIGFVNFLDTKFWAGNSCYVLRTDEKNISIKYLFYWLKSRQGALVNLKAVGGIPAINLGPLSKFECPIPPIEIQKEIVEILDNLESMTTSLSSGLPAEIAARKKQYDYYRDKLLTFKELKSA